MDKPQNGKIWLIVILALVLLGAGAGGYFMFAGKSHEGKNNGGVADKDNGSGNKNAPSGASDIRWEMMSDGNYQPSSTPPTCPSPLVLEPPADLSKVVSVLYPGQTRGGDYKSHGGLRFADGANEIAVTAPMDASVIDGGRYLVDGEIQYLFDFVNSCGIKYRLGHLRVLSAPFAAVVDQFPQAQNMDSRTTQINPPLKVNAGDTVATTVGLISAGNAFFDFGVYDLRQENEASKNVAFQTAHASDRDQSWHGLCWLDLLSPENVTKVKSLPATAPGSQSDYCK